MKTLQAFELVLCCVYDSIQIPWSDHLSYLVVLIFEVLFVLL